MYDLSNMLEMAPFALNKTEKLRFLNDTLNELTRYHYENCDMYKRMLNARSYILNSENDYRNIPFLPVRLFKDLDLKSIKDDEVFKTLTSSGTTGQAVSKIYLDKDTASLQQKILVKIVSDFTDSSRMPMLIIDCPSVVRNREMFSARGAGILGFSIFGADKTYALNDEMLLDFDSILKFLEKHNNKKILIFGFTFMIWQHFYKEIKKQDIKLDFSNAIMIHGGGWKKLISQAVSANRFKECLNDVCGITSIHDYYGMVEQTGCIYMECEAGNLHASVFSDILTRRSEDFSLCDIGETGIMEVVSVIPKSYCGHALLTEDEGVILGEDDCKCGRLGKYFKISGRIQNAEIRGCSDTYAARF